MTEKMIDVMIVALTEKMGRINSAAIISGIRTEKMTEDYKACEQMIDRLNLAKEQLASQKSMKKK